MQRLPVSFRHLRRLTDETGIVEHALGRIPRRKEGYSTDDQARALWTCIWWLEVAEEMERSAEGEREKAPVREANKVLEPLIDTYLAFLLWAQRENGHFHNNFTYERAMEPEEPSDDCLGRCLWAAALAWAHFRNRDRSRQLAAEEILLSALGRLRELRYPRGSAYALAALGLLLQHGFPYQFLRDDAAILGQRLVHAYRKHSTSTWRWYEPALTYSNGVIPWGLLSWHEACGDDGLLQVGLDSLGFLIEHMTNERGQICPIGNRGWCTPASRARWDQQPIDVMKLALAAAKAHQLTGENSYATVVRRCREWFHGDNDGGWPMCDAAEGSGYDGLGEKGRNLNQGAESTISYLLTEVIHLRLTKRNGMR